MMFAYMWIKNENGKPVPGSVKEAGKEGSCEILGMDYDIGISANHDVQPPVLTRRRGPVHVEKPLDRATPWLQEAIDTGRKLGEIKIMCYRNEKARQEDQPFSMIFTGVQLTSIFVNIGPGFENDTPPHSMLETLGFRYDAFIWKDEQGDVVYEDPGDENPGEAA